MCSCAVRRVSDQAVSGAAGTKLVDGRADAWFMADSCGAGRTGPSEQPAMAAIVPALRLMGEPASIQTISLRSGLCSAPLAHRMSRSQGSDGQDRTLLQDRTAAAQPRPGQLPDPARRARRYRRRRSSATCSTCATAWTRRSSTTAPTTPTASPRPAAARAATRHELPGLWFSESEIHALLTMHQLMAGLDDDGVLARHLAPMMDKLQGMLGADAGRGA